MAANRPLLIGDKLTPWRIARMTRVAFVPLRISALLWQEYWRAWHAAWRGPKG